MLIEIIMAINSFIIEFNDYRKGILRYNLVEYTQVSGNGGIPNTLGM